MTSRAWSLSLLTSVWSSVHRFEESKVRHSFFPLVVWERWFALNLRDALLEPALRNRQHQIQFRYQARISIREQQVTPSRKRHEWTMHEHTKEIFFKLKRNIPLSIRFRTISKRCFECRSRVLPLGRRWKPHETRKDEALSRWRFLQDLSRSPFIGIFFFFKRFFC